MSYFSNHSFTVKQDLLLMESVLDRFKTGHLWLGNIETPQEVYLDYFEQDNGRDYSNFFIDIGYEEEYDEDFIIIFDLLPKPVSLEHLLPEIPIDCEQEKAKLTKMCTHLNFTEFNTFVFYSDPKLIVPNNKNYNGLTYLGNFKSEYY